MEKKDFYGGLPASLAFRADSIEVQTMADDLVARLTGYFACQLVGQVDFWVYDFPAANADEMWMRIGSLAIVAIVVVAEAKFQ